jgi:hypothetical protein
MDERETAAYRAGLEAAASVLDTHGDSAATEALGQQLCCSGRDCGCQGADVGTYLQHLIRALAQEKPQEAPSPSAASRVADASDLAATVRYSASTTDFTPADAVRWEYRAGEWFAPGPGY